LWKKKEKKSSQNPGKKTANGFMMTSISLYGIPTEPGLSIPDLSGEGQNVSIYYFMACQ
jgi:hypothetical protein